MKNFNEYLIEKLVIDSDVKVTAKPNVRPPRIFPQKTDMDKMDYYYQKGSKPSRLVATIKDPEKLKRRFAVACHMKWNEAIREFGNALVARKIYTREEVDAYIAK